MSSDDKELLAKLEGNLKMTVFGQDDAVTQMVSAIKLARAGLRGGQKPIGSFLLAGPTGVGKTELTRQLHYRWGWSYYALTCLNTWSVIPFRA